MMRERDVISDATPDVGRFWCSYELLEEFHAGMWTTAPSHDHSRLISLAVELLCDCDSFRLALIRVLEEWPVSCRAEFTSPGNHLAWLGQAACCITHGVPEELTRLAWWRLTPAEMNSANKTAKFTIGVWQKKHTLGQLTLKGVGGAEIIS